MTRIPPEAVQAAAEAYHNTVCPGAICTTVIGESHLGPARAALEAAEKVWPHKPAGFIVQTQPNPRGGTIGKQP